MRLKRSLQWQISSYAGGLPEVNIHGVTGFLADIGDFESMASSALMLLENEDVLNTFRKNAYEQAKRFDISVILPQYEAYYEKIVKRFRSIPRHAQETVIS